MRERDREGDIAEKVLRVWKHAFQAVAEVEVDLSKDPFNHHPKHEHSCISHQ